MAIATCALVAITATYTYYAKKQVELTRQTLNNTIDAMRLEQRPWLGYSGFAIYARKNSTTAWEKREPKQGEEIRVRLSIKNVGKTPALNISLMSVTPEVISFGSEDTINVLDDAADEAKEHNTIFPESEKFGHYIRPYRLTAQEFLEYSTRKKQLFFWAKVYYCDIAGMRHWTQTRATHTYASKGFNIISSSVSPSPGEANHPDCQK